jgi:hypothetical protein
MNKSKYIKINKAIGLYKRLIKIKKVLQTKKPRLTITLWLDRGTLDEGDLITKKEIVKRLRKRKLKITKQLMTLEKTIGKQKMNQIKILALQELENNGF